MTFRYSIPDSQQRHRPRRHASTCGSTATCSRPCRSPRSTAGTTAATRSTTTRATPTRTTSTTRRAPCSGTTYPVGTKIRLQVSSTAQSPSFTIDLADFENVVGAPIGKPANAIDVVADFGADPTGGAADNTAKFQAAVNAGQAQGRPVYVPQGTLHALEPRHRRRGDAARRRAVVLGARSAGTRPSATGRSASTASTSTRAARRRTSPSRTSPSSATSRSAWTTTRSTPSAARCPTRSSTTSGCSTPRSAPGWTARWTNFTIRNSRILDQTADGVNFHIGVTNSHGHQHVRPQHR